MDSPIRFFLPGPTHVPQEILESLARPLVGHRSPAFKELYRGLQPRLRALFRTEAADVLLATGSATLVMESAILSTVGRRVLNLTCGAFSERWHQISRTLGKEADTVSVPWGEAVDPDLVLRALARQTYDAVTVVHNETSTGVMNPLAEIARAVREHSDALVLVDAVSSLGGAPVEVDAWGLDLVLAGVQKALALPPGLALFSLSERARERLAGVERRGFYTDLARYVEAHRKDGTITTPAISLLYALDRQLDRIAAEGLEARWERHRGLQERTAAWAAERGFAFASAAGHRSWTVSCLEPPEGVTAPRLVERLAACGYTVGGGYGAWKAKTFRIGHMGEVREADLDALLRALDGILECEG